ASRRAGRGAGPGVVAPGADVVDGHGHRAVGPLAQRPAVLALDTNGVPALLGRGDVIDEEDSVRAGEGRGQLGAGVTEDTRRIPGALVDELLQSLLGVLAGQAVGQGHAPGQRLDALAFAVEQEALEVDTGPAGGFGVREIVREDSGVVA